MIKALTVKQNFIHVNTIKNVVLEFYYGTCTSVSTDILKEDIGEYRVANTSNICLLYTSRCV